MSKPIFAGLLSLCLAAALTVASHEARSQSAAPGAAPAPPAAAPPAAAPGAVAQAPTDTGCEERNFLDGYYFPGGRKTFDDERYSALALRLNTPVYQESSGEARAAKILQFSERVRVMDPGEGTGRIRIKDSTSQPVGWVARNTVLCGQYPIVDKRESGGTGLYKRVVVRTDTEVQGQVVAKKLYQAPEGQKCEGPCAEVSRFQWYFIYAEDNGHYLISADANLRSSSSRLLGWLPKADGYSWNTALGLRPKEELAEHAPGAEEKYVCAYKTMALLTTAKPEDCNQILGGPRWFGLDVRMAVLNQTDRAYEVLFSNAGTAGRDNTGAARGLNNLDVFFVIDGTKSMQPSIDQIKKLMAQINTKMQGKTTSGGVVRYGFRVYRDSSAKTRLDGVSNSESLALSKTVCDKTNQSQFDAAFAPVKAYDPDEDDDFSENLFGGLVQAAEDISGCPNNAKLVFVIGDAGYDGAKQKSRNFPELQEANVVTRFKPRQQTAQSPGAPPIIIFIEPPKDTATISNRVEYDKAYAAFKTQGQSLLSQIYAGTAITNFASNFIQLPSSAGAAAQQAAIEDTLRQVDAAMNPGVIAFIATSLNSGESLVKIIERLRNNSQMNIPIKFLQYIEASLCNRLGEQCTKQVVEAVNVAFVPIDPNVIPEVLLSKDQLDKWLKILNIYKSFSNNVAGAAGRSQLVNTMYAAIGSLLQIDMQNDSVSMANKLQFQAGLPNSGRSKLMQYTDSDLTNVSLVPSCEIENLKQYGIKKYDVLNTVYSNDGKYRPIFVETTWPEGGCPMSPKGKNVPFIDGDVRGQPLNPPGGQTNYSMMHRRGNDSFFWLPVNYLP